MSTVPAVRGMQDLTPEAAVRFLATEARLIAVLNSFAYEPVRLPLVEHLSLYSRGVGEATDVVEKEMFVLQSRADDAEAQVLRPEGTAGCVRMLNEHGLLYNQVQRVFYSGPMFRYERPQKGRTREFYQIGAEVFGLNDPDIDAELLQLCLAFWRELGIEDAVQLELNCIGASADRQRFGEALVAFLTPMIDQLDADSRSRLGRNPLRILDSKVPATQALLADAPRLHDYLSDSAQQHFSELKSLLDALGINYQVNEKLVRGLDYYNNTVFEWTTDLLGSQGTVCAGGRYDGLVEQLGGRATAGAGFALGMERIDLLLQQVRQGVAATPRAAADVYLCVMQQEHSGFALTLAQSLRESVAGLRVRTHAGGGKLKNQLKRADASGATWALILGADEVAVNEVTVKNLRDQSAQVRCAIPDLAPMLRGAAPHRG